MSKDIHKWTDGRYTLMFDEHTFFVWDNENDERMTALQTTKRLNEQQATIKQLESDKAIAEDYANIFEKENVKLRRENKELQEEIKLLKPTNVEQYEQIVQLQEENEKLRKQIQNYEQLIANSYGGIEETLDGFVGKYVIWEDELQKYRKKNKEVIDDE